jgi:chemotaxis signal transduction protein
MSETRQLVIFTLADEEYALPITRVQEIIRYTQPRSVASSTPWIRGVINLRGKIVPVCDLAMRTTVGCQAARLMPERSPSGLRARQPRSPA